MQWSEILADPSLHDLPYKIETNEHGQIVMSPASNEHGYFQVEIAAELRGHDTGRTYSEASVATPRGVKVANVAWCSDSFHSKHAGENPFSAAPELCVEIVSPGNSRKEIEEKRSLYLTQGAKEVWECDLNGHLAFFDDRGEKDCSELFPDFPKRIG